MHENTSVAAARTRRRTTRLALLLTAAALAAGGTGAYAATGNTSAATSHPPVKLVVTNPKPHDIAGRHGDFTVDIVATAQNAAGNQSLSPTHGYRPGLNLPPAHTFGPGLPDPKVPGLVVTLSTTPQAAGGPHANLAGVFQLNSVSRHNGMRRIITDWEVGSPGFFGTNRSVTLTAFLVRGTAPGMVTRNLQPISNVVHETFKIGG